jgi:hypothetical protein
MKSKEVGTKARLKNGVIVNVNESRCAAIEGVATPSSADNAEVVRLSVTDLDGTNNRWIKPDDIDSFVV